MYIRRVWLTPKLESNSNLNFHVRILCDFCGKKQLSIHLFLEHFCLEARGVMGVSKLPPLLRFSFRWCYTGRTARFRPDPIRSQFGLLRISAGFRPDFGSRSRLDFGQLDFGWTSVAFRPDFGQIWTKSISLIFAPALALTSRTSSLVLL
jgi:hypothetical protein